MKLVAPEAWTQWSTHFLRLPLMVYLHPSRSVPDSSNLRFPITQSSMRCPAMPHTLLGIGESVAYTYFRQTGNRPY